MEQSQQKFDDRKIFIKSKSIKKPIIWAKFCMKNEGTELWLFDEKKGSFFVQSNGEKKVNIMAEFIFNWGPWKLIYVAYEIFTMINQW